MTIQELAEQKFPKESWTQYYRDIWIAGATDTFPMDTAPKDGSEILVKDGGMNKWRIAKWSEYHKGWKYSNHDLIGNPQCWRPL